MIITVKLVYAIIDMCLFKNIDYQLIQIYRWNYGGLLGDF